MSSVLQLELDIADFLLIENFTWILNDVISAAEQAKISLCEETIDLKFWEKQSRKRKKKTGSIFGKNIFF